MNLHRHGPASLLLAVSFLGGGTSYARAETWVVLPVDEADAHVTSEDLRAVVDELGRKGIDTLGGPPAAAAVERAVSTPPPSITDAEVEAWRRRAREALDSLARTDFATALEQLEPAQETSRRSASALNRPDDLRGALLDTCLYSVRALLGIGKAATAEARAEECARLSPGVTPDRRMHPPDVRTFYEDVVDAIGARGGELRITSTPSGCGVRLQGVPLGSTPADIGDLPEGAYEVQVECGGSPGRVRRVVLEGRTSSVHVDAGLDEALRTRDGLGLAYESKAQAPSAVHGRALAVALGVQSALLVRATTDGLHLVRVEATGSSVRSARPADFGRSTKGGALSAALDLLVAGPTNPRVTQRPPHGQFVSGVSLAAIGTGALVVSYSLFAVRTTRAADDMVAAPTNENQARWLNLRTGMLYTGVAGAASLVTAMPLALPCRAKTPWWGWLAGGAGVALGATAIALAVTAPPRPDVSRVADPRGYVDRDTRTDGAFLAGVTAAPLLTMPLVYLLRRADKRLPANLEPELRVTRQAGYVGVRARY